MTAAVLTRQGRRGLSVSLIRRIQSSALYTGYPLMPYRDRNRHVQGKLKRATTMREHSVRPLTEQDKDDTVPLLYHCFLYLSLTVAGIGLIVLGSLALHIYHDVVPNPMASMASARTYFEFKQTVAPTVLYIAGICLIVGSIVAGMGMVLGGPLVTLFELWRMWRIGKKRRLRRILNSLYLEMAQTLAEECGEESCQEFRTFVENRLSLREDDFDSPPSKREAEAELRSLFAFLRQRHAARQEAFRRALGFTGRTC
jgi:hypothetical protein